jgi:carbon-monoxide dehydrogenase iron sulfur subunit
VAVKCDRCKDLEAPECVRACPSKALVFATQNEFAEMMRRDAAIRIAREAGTLARA